MESFEETANVLILLHLQNFVPVYGLLLRVRLFQCVDEGKNKYEILERSAFHFKIIWGHLVT
jgi:hypothetical protein